MVYNLLIVEDDEIQRKNLILMLRELECEFNIFDSDSINDALFILNNNHIDLFYLDHHLPDGSGIELGKKIREIEKYKFTWIIFLTSYVQFMIEAFKEIHCYDYILKPYSKDVVKSLTSELLKGTYNVISESNENQLDNIEFTIGGIKLKLPTDQIYFIEINIRTCHIHTKVGVYKAEKITLSRLSELLPKEIFVQSHRAYIVNINYIYKLHQYKGSWVIAFKEYDKTALVGTTYRKNILSNIKNNNIIINNI